MKCPKCGKEMYFSERHSYYEYGKGDDDLIIVHICHSCKLYTSENYNGLKRAEMPIEGTFV